MKAVPDDARDDYWQNGYVVLCNLLADDELAMLRDCCNSLLAEPPDDDNGGRSHNIGRGQDRRFLRHRHQDLPELSTFVLGQGMKRLAATFIGETPHLFNEQFVVKGPKTGASFAWHQDSAYVGFDHKPYLTLWMALDDTTVENGAVFVLQRDLNRDQSIIEHRWDEEGKELIGYDGEDPGEPALVPAGSVVAFSSVTLHRSSANITDLSRRGFIAQYSNEPILDPTTKKPKTFAKPL
ncbi:MAG: phytanoyl-CoA dioxygenase family protein [Pseudomonadota bacterium]